MSLAQDIAILKQIPMLSDFAEDQLRLLAFSAESMEYGSGQRLFDQDERADGGLVITSGTVSLQIRGEDGFDEVDRVGEGTLLGETALLAENKRPCRAEAIEGVRIIRIRRALFKRMIQEYPELAKRLFDQRVNQFRHTVSVLRPLGDKMAELEQLNAERRVRDDEKKS
ncbi:cyclic nucleotide-binding domain-containing protein [Roseibium porphyridii]|uniref:Cyclic nucleotide-binding domain-containing protein n=1 Tax=Roseibium porphyridii TaxID=2866279 RepID=A0ABY8FAG0_9HYPH|nr:MULTISPECIES: cyclic nucleotide-binding domain-containing protein [Stappiaceae]QFT29321.1 Acetyltransferase Pat [Labrenzia sp. THAF82]WFE92399.1 cyclic nucleotide-binding domain-containing protein [Roseibium sp. KMA01]